MSPNKPVRVLSLFTGAGGLDLGFHLEGFEIAACVEVEPLFCESLEMNKPKYLPRGCLVIPKDIRDFDYSLLGGLKIDFVIGGPPCQSFSAAGRRAGGAPGTLDERGTLFEAYCKLIDVARPIGFLFENVRGILGSNGGLDWERVSHAFRSLGYRVSHEVLDACDYGAPQHRERVILVGHKADQFLFPRPTHGPDSLDGRPHVTAGKALKDLPRQPQDGHFASGKYSHLVPEVPPGENYLHFTSKRGYPAPIFAYRSRFSDFLYKAHPERPIKTIIANPGKYSGPFHWDNRRFTIPEYKRLQAFPDDYHFAGTYAQQVEQIGNSVSPPLSRALARTVASQLFGAEPSVQLLPAGYKLSFDKRKGMQARATRARHEAIERMPPRDSTFRLYPYAATWSKNNSSYIRREGMADALDADKSHVFNLTCRTKGRSATLNVVRADTPQRRQYLIVACDLALSPPGAGSGNGQSLKTRLYSPDPADVQTLWDAIDDFVIRSSSFHSLFELYGHFTEPHPVFRIERFEAFSDHPILEFGEHAADFANCSKFFPTTMLKALFHDSPDRDVLDIIEELRSYRYDVRCHETNVAIPEGYYMVAYPFTLPLRRQMNFRVKRPVVSRNN